MPVLTSVPEHKHCEICGKPIPVGDRLCGSDACLKAWKDALKAKKRGMYMFVGLILILLLMSTIGRQYL